MSFYGCIAGFLRGIFRIMFSVKTEGFENLPDEEGFLLVNQVEREEWTTAIENAKERAQNQQGVQFNYPDTAPFQEACAPLHESMLASSPNLVPIYEAIQAYNAQYPSTGS